MPLVPTIIRCCAHIFRLVCGQTDGRTNQVTLAAHARRGLMSVLNFNTSLTHNNQKRTIIYSAL